MLFFDYIFNLDFVLGFMCVAHDSCVASLRLVSF